MTIGCLGLDQAQVRIPEDMSVIGFDDSEWAVLCTALTECGSRLQHGNIGCQIYSTADSRPPEWQRLFKPELVIRASCGQCVGRTSES